MEEHLHYMRLLLAVLFVFLGIALQLKLGLLLAVRPDFVFVTLATLSFFLSFFELVIVGLLTIFALTWQPYPSVELLFVVAVPLLFFLARKIIIPFEGWLANILLASSGIIVFYLLFDFEGTVRFPLVVVLDVAVSVLFGICLFYLVRHSTDEVAHGGQ